MSDPLDGGIISTVSQLRHTLRAAAQRVRAYMNKELFLDIDITGHEAALLLHTGLKPGTLVRHVDADHGLMFQVRQVEHPLLLSRQMYLVLDGDDLEELKEAWAALELECALDDTRIECPNSELYAALDRVRNTFKVEDIVVPDLETVLNLRQLPQGSIATYTLELPSIELTNLLWNNRDQVRKLAELGDEVLDVLVMDAIVKENYCIDTEDDHTIYIIVSWLLPEDTND